MDEENNNAPGYLETPGSVTGGGQYYYAGGNGGVTGTGGATGDNQSYYRPSSGMAATKGRNALATNSNKWSCGVKESSAVGVGGGSTTGSMSPSSSNNSNTPPSTGIVPNTEFSFPPTTSSFMDNFYHHAHYFPYHHHHHHGQPGFQGQAGAQISNGDLPMDPSEFYHHHQHQHQQQTGQQQLQQNASNPNGVLFPNEGGHGGAPFLTNPSSYYTNIGDDKMEGTLSKQGEDAAELAKGLKGRKMVNATKYLSSCKEDVENNNNKKHLMEDRDLEGNEIKSDIDVGHVKLEKIARRSQPC